ncbi:hypothetical protein BKD09_35900 [Bradyrhizobium japonicum]|uniref:Uncharacterized protein n=1 Tax=Bradyrhizobium japonicum TaxID=375 RepID=A0A1L3FKB4_BRAJP|nr:hypothetical protein BKD09_35900 [Bradyrhizobium japonicum]
MKAGIRACFDYYRILSSETYAKEREEFRLLLRRPRTGCAIVRDLRWPQHLNARRRWPPVGRESELAALSATGPASDWAQARDYRASSTLPDERSFRLRAGTNQAADAFSTSMLED